MRPPRYGKWLVSRETVLPWPDLTNAKGFLPPRAVAQA